MFKKKIAIVLLCVLLVIFTAGIFAFADNGAVLLNSNDFKSGSGICAVQNAKASDGVNYGQSALTLREGADGGKYAVFHPTLTGTNPAHGFVQVDYSDVYLGPTDDVEYFILEFDFTTESKYLDKVEFEFIGKDTSEDSVFAYTKPYVATDENGKFTINAAGNTVNLEQERGKWQHLTFVVKTELNDASGVGSGDSVIYIYCNGIFVGADKIFQKDAVYMHSLRISQIKDREVDAADTFCFDNLKVTKLTSAYNGNLARVLADTTVSLTEFDLSNYKVGYVFPRAAAIAKIGDEKYSTVSELEAALKAGDEVTLLADIYEKIDISCECSIYNPDGYSFTYDAGTFEKAESDSTVSFLEPFDSVEVVWHIGDETVRQTYTDRILPTPPAYSQTVEREGIVYKAIGFSKSEGGEVVTDLGFVSPYNKEFWLVYAEPAAYTVHKNQTKTYAYSNTEAVALISSSQDGDTVCLLSDVETLGAFRIESKKLVIDLGGHTLHMAEGATADMFTVAANGDLTVKHGRIEAYKNGRIPAGGTAVVRRRVFATTAESSSLLASDLVLDACKMLAVISSGNASFEKCVIDFTKDYDNMIDLYANNSDTAPTTLNLKNCSIKAYKTIVNVFKPSSVSKNNAIINAENCNMETAERVFAAEAAQVIRINGGQYDCKYLFGKLNANKEAVAYISEGTLLNFDVLDEKGGLKIDLSGAAIARINDNDYAYTVTGKYAKIGWVWPNKTVSEVWRVGDMPICPFDIPENTREIKYEVPKIVPVDVAASYVLKTSQNFETKVSAELGMSFSMNFYVSEINFTSVKVGNATYTRNDAKLVEVGGKTYYKFNTGAISAQNSPDTLAVTVSVPSAFGERQYRYEINLLKYLDEILSGGYDFGTYRLALSVLGCIKAQLPDNYSNKVYTDIAKKYNTDILLSEIEGRGADISKIASAVSAVTVVNSGKIAYRLAINPSFSGEIKVTYILSGSERTDKFSISGGKYNSSDFIDIGTDAAAFAAGIKVSVADAFATVDMSLCKEQANGVNSEELMAIYAYSKEVKKYTDENKEG